MKAAWSPAACSIPRGAWPLWPRSFGFGNFAERSAHRKFQGRTHQRLFDPTVGTFLGTVSWMPPAIPSPSPGLWDLRRVGNGGQRRTRSAKCLFHRGFRFRAAWCLSGRSRSSTNDVATPTTTVLTRLRFCGGPAHNPGFPPGSSERTTGLVAFEENDGASLIGKCITGCHRDQASITMFPRLAPCRGASSHGNVQWAGKRGRQHVGAADSHAQQLTISTWPT